ncbi:ABC transporter ATP-binding protein [Aureimonas ureilytica]|uniref:ABC transporter ATP-binding protein n=1 Tax=Aureimonas ureilytica TaxID=401562 RepID=UPI0003788005|nr:ABC transporter ATP-binding protein [Aureimonas ureilytica]
MTGPSLNADGSLLSVQGLARSYVEPAPAFWRRARRRPVLADIDLAIHPGERVALIGASGAGKTTLLRTLLAIEEPDCGHILCQCQPVKPAGPAALRWYRRQVQYIPQDPAASLDPRMSVLAQVREPLHRLDVDCDCRSRAAEALASVGLGPEFHERRRAELSGGQAQRVAIARAIATRPALLVADEPVSGLDLPIRRQVSDVLLRLSKARGTALLVVSHDLASVARLCERILVMSEGRIVEDRPTGELVAAPRHPSTRALVEAARLAHSRPG